MSKQYRPRTPGTRGLILPSHDELTKLDGKKVKPTKSLVSFKRSKGGRNNLGRITCRHRGGGHRKLYRLVDFKRDKVDIPAKVASIEYDPNRSAHIALLNYADGEKRYILAPKGLEVGATVMTTDSAPFLIGNCMALKDMPLGTIVHNIELQPGKGGKFVRSAGLGAQLMARADGTATLRMPSGEVRTVLETCRATIGEVSNAEHFHRVLAKAGRKRWMGIRPTVRGTAMNPVDHPHGGGEGRSRGFIPQSPWALQTKGKLTRRPRKSTKHIVKPRTARR